MKRWLWHAVRFAVTAGFLVYVYHLIQWEDRTGWEVPGPDAGWVRFDGTEVVRKDGRISFAWKNGRRTEHEEKDVKAIPVEGFLSLFGRANKGLIFAMAAALLVPYTILALRWWILLRGHGFAVPFGRIFFVNYAGVFFNNFLPGGVGGDLTKMILASSGEERKAAVVGTVLLDRVIGLAVLILLGAACLVPFAGRFPDGRIPGLVFGLAGAVIAGYLAYFSPPVRRLLGSRGGVWASLDGVFRSANEKKRLTAAVAGLSVVSQVASILIIYGLGRSLGITATPLWNFFVFEPIIFIVTAMPISMGGWGVQEGAYQQLFAGFGGMDPNQAIALSVLFKLSSILVSIPGGLLFALGAARRGSRAP